jgi:aquaporin Z
MQVVLQVSSRPRLARYTGACAAALVAVYIAVESPLSGMSMNPARTVGSAAFAHVWTGWWIYFVAPLLGMLSSAELFRILPRAEAALCAKLYHAPGVRCIFCEHHAGTAA